VTGSSNARFTCDALRNHLRQSQCQSFNAKPLHDLIEQQLLIAISPASISLSIEAVRKLESDVALLEKNHRQNIERSTFQSDLARRRYEEVDPSNRLVAAELERRWEASLCKQREAEEALNRLRQEKQNRLNASDIAKIESLSNDIPNLWRQASTSSIDKQTIARTLIEEVSVGVVQDNERVDVTIRWTGGYESRHQILRAVGNFGQLECADAIKQRIVKLKRQGHCHEAVASELNQQGYRSAQQQPFTKAIVSQLCRQFQSSGTSCEAIGGYEDCWLIGQLSQRLAVSVSTLRNWLSRNWLATIRTGERWIIWADEKELNRLKALADYQRGPHCRATPESLTTPRKPV
jgi:hypothetical protein